MKRRDFAACLALLALNLLVRGIYLASEPLCHDEPFSIYHAQFAPAGLVASLRQYNNPPLFELILHAWIKVFGISELSVRVLPMLFSSISAVLIFLIGRDFFKRRAGLVASLLFTFSTMQVWYAHDCRVYTLFLLLTLCSFYLFFSLLRNGGLSGIAAVGLLMTNVLLVYSHYFGFWVWFVQGLLILGSIRKARVLLTYGGITVCGLLLYLPQILTMYERFSDSAGRGTWLQPPAGAESLYNMIWSFSNAPLSAVVCLLLFVAALVKYASVSPRQKPSASTVYLLVWFFVPFFLMFFLSYRVPMFLDRYLIFITPAFYLLLALCLDFLFTGKAVYYGMSVFLVACFVMTCSVNPSKKRAVRETVGYIRKQQDRSSLVMVCPPEFMTTFAYYYRQDHFRQLDGKSEYGRLSKSLASEHVVFVEHPDSQLLEKASHYRRIIYLDAGADFTFPGNGLKESLLRRFRLLEEHAEPEFFHVYVLSNDSLRQ